MMKRLVLTILMMAVVLSVPAQKAKTAQRKAVAAQQNRKGTASQKKPATAAKTKKASQPKNTAKTKQITSKDLQKERQNLQASKAANIKKQEELKRNVKRGMENLMILDQEIVQKRKVVDTIRNDIMTLNGHITMLDAQLDTLQKELEERRMRFMKSMRYMHRNRSVQNQLMFVFSADNFNQIYRRMRFTREYAAYQRAQGEAVKSKQEQVRQKKLELTEARQHKSHLLSRGETEKRLLEGKQNEQQVQVNQLKKQQKTVETLIREQQRKETELNARIDKLIAEELAREKARIEAEMRRKEREEARRREREAAARAETGEKAPREDKADNSNTAEERRSEKRASRRTETDFSIPAEDRLTTGSFEANRGRLPLPITGAYKLVRGFGPYSPEGLSQVRLQSNGWHLKGQQGAKAQCVFDGQVSGVYYQGGSYIVTVRHGKFISAYINLSKVSVSNGQRVKARQVIGTLGADQTMQFQLRNWNTLLNPSRWLSR